MKNIIILSIVIVIVYFGYTNSINKTIVFNGTEYKLAREEGGNGLYKFHYTESGKDTGKNDYIEILKFDKNELTNDGLSGTKEMLKKVYKSKYISGSNGQFGVFGANNQNFAYLVRSETADTYWFANFVIQSGKSNKSDAKASVDNIITELNNLLDSMI
jgi:hypothetical protein